MISIVHMYGRYKQGGASFYNLGGQIKKKKKKKIWKKEFKNFFLDFFFFFFEKTFEPLRGTSPQAWYNRSTSGHKPLDIFLY
jgi:hypothetical protein